MISEDVMEMLACWSTIVDLEQHLRTCKHASAIMELKDAQTDFVGMYEHLSAPDRKSLSHILGSWRLMELNEWPRSGLYVNTTMEQN